MSVEKFPRPWSKGVMMICSKCGQDISNLTVPKEKLAEQIRDNLRQELRNAGGNNKEIRVMISGCLSVCQSEKQAVMFQPAHAEAEFLTFDPNTDQNELAHFLKGKLK